MITLLSCAKTMAAETSVGVPFSTEPHFSKEALEKALRLSRLSPEDLSRLLRVNRKIAAENKLRYLDFSVAGKIGVPALLAYTGIVFKRLCPSDFSADDFRYAQEHLRLTSFLYGLLRPLDAILPYRLEGNVCLPGEDGMTAFDFWKSRLTDFLIAEIKALGGVLCNLASDEMKNLFDWKRVERETVVVTPEFRVWKNGRPVTVVVYTKMMRGEMTRFILKNRVEDPRELPLFTSGEGFAYEAELSTPLNPVFCV